jgi:hypothetical protein
VPRVCGSSVVVASALLIACGDSDTPTPTPAPAPTTDVVEAPPPVTLADADDTTPPSPIAIDCGHDLSRTDIAALFRKPVIIHGGNRPFNTCFLATGLGGDVRVTLDPFETKWWNTLTSIAKPYPGRDKALYLADEHRGALYATRAGLVCSVKVSGWNDPTLASQYSLLRGDAVIARFSALCEQVFDHLGRRTAALAP